MQTREDAVRAKDDLNNVILHDNELKIGWGKGVAIPSAPLYLGTGDSSAVLPARPSVGASVPPPGATEVPPWVEQLAAAQAEPAHAGESSNRVSRLQPVAEH